MLRLSLAILLLAAPPAWAEAPSFAVPVDCRIGQECFIQNFVDRDPGPGARDYTCGALSYDGHAGTDFRVPDLAAMRRGVAVLAAAAGVVVAVRDGVEDVSIRDPGAPSVAGREAGNRVAIDHGGGWLTQYSHLRKGSVAVRLGERVAAGQRLGLIGLSGNTEFPHVDFAIRRDNRTVDPFAGADPPAACGVGGTPLWSDEARRVLAYQPTGLLNAGFAAETPNDGKARDGAYGEAAPGRDAPVLAFWADVFGGQAGDRLELRIHGADGREIQRSSGTVPRPLAVLFAAAAAKRPAAGWPPGVYRGRFTLTRNGAVAVEAERRVEIR